MKLLCNLIVVCSLAVVFILNAATSVHADWPYFGQELIVKFKPGLSPEMLRAVVKRREETASVPVVGPIKIWWEDLPVHRNDIKNHEEYVFSLMSVERQLQQVEYEPILMDEDGVKDIYLLRFSAPVAVGQAVRLYRQLPVVEYAEPNYQYGESGI